MDEPTKKFWKSASELSTKGRWVNFEDEEPQILTIENWTPQKVDTPWGKKEALQLEDGRYLKLDSKRLKYLLAEFAGEKVNLEVIRHDSKPNSRNTWYSVDKL